MSDVKSEACREIAFHLRKRWPHEPPQRVEEMSRRIDGVLCEHEIPLAVFCVMLYWLPDGADLRLTWIEAWAEAYAEECERVLAHVPKR